ncbi:phage tail protein I [Burkholderia pseudomallei]|nr:phage tail protein I [Burkholderia pseudomallei]
MTRRATSLLPPNATALERRLADTNARISDIPVTCLISSGHFNLGERPRLLQLNNTAA